MHANKARLRSYGLSEREYEALLDEYDGVCGICGKCNADGAQLAIDHDHRCCDRSGSCGECVRGLLCRKCNRKLGLIEADDGWFSMALLYLGKYPPAQRKASQNEHAKLMTEESTQNVG